MNNDHIFEKTKFLRVPISRYHLANKCGQDIPENGPNAVCMLSENIQGYEL